MLGARLSPPLCGIESIDSTSRCRSARRSPVHPLRGRFYRSSSCASLAPLYVINDFSPTVLRGRPIQIRGGRIFPIAISSCQGAMCQHLRGIHLAHCRSLSASAASSVPLPRSSTQYQTSFIWKISPQIENLLVLFIFHICRVSQLCPIVFRRYSNGRAVYRTVRGGRQLRERPSAQRKAPARRRNPARRGPLIFTKKKLLQDRILQRLRWTQAYHGLGLDLDSLPQSADCGPCAPCGGALTTRPMPGITNLPAPPLASFTASLCNSSKKRAACFFGVLSFSAMCETIFVLLSGLAAI